MENYNFSNGQNLRCGSCGQTVEDGSMFCPYCGERITVQAGWQMGGGYYRADHENNMDRIKERLSKGAGQIVCVIFMVLLLIMLITDVFTLFTGADCLKRMVSIIDITGEAREAMNVVSGIIIALGLFGMIPFILEVIGTCMAVISGMQKNITTTGFTLINAGLILSLIGAVLKGISSLGNVLFLGIAINSEMTKSGQDGIIPIIVACVLLIVAVLVLRVFFYLGLMRPASSAKRMLTSGKGDVNLSIFAMIILGFDALFKLFMLIGSASFSPSRIMSQIEGLMIPMDVESRIVVNTILNFLKQISVQQMVRSGVGLLVVVLAIVVTIMFKNVSNSTDPY